MRDQNSVVPSRSTVTRNEVSRTAPTAAGVLTLNSETESSGRRTLFQVVPLSCCISAERPPLLLLVSLSRVISVLAARVCVLPSKKVMTARPSGPVTTRSPWDSSSPSTAARSSPAPSTSMRTSPPTTVRIVLPAFTLEPENSAR
jgi:hypothetical protein